MNNFKIEIVSDINIAKNIWESLSPHKTLYHDWDFRYIYSSLLNYEIKFYTAFVDDEPVCLLPLELNKQRDCLMFFGCNFAEDNSFLTKKGFEKYEQIILDTLKDKYSLEFMDKSYKNSKLMENVYFLPLNGIINKETYINKYWSGKSKQNLKSQIRKIDTLGVKIKYNDFNDIDRLIELNKINFGEESSYNKPKRTEYIKLLVTNFDIHTISIVINEKVESVGISILYKDVYYGLGSGTNNGINGLGKYLILEKIQQAINCGASVYNAREGNLGWKETFGLSKKPQFEISN